ncbi:hypothetical protein [Paenibacillus xylanilyticus]|uniref:Copper amine oxidase n=1 Tax=Paenibacillus xylanilyticus TaxID=248903 RepID=A0A7Y6C1H1_9BACL|nr:hypothetical protein [Paenibacillus xylanilyticus]NUU78065.1 hypothetical protein [Paenibacillus xylanilyticus]
MSMWFIPKLLSAAFIALSGSLSVPNQDHTVLAEIKENHHEITLNTSTKPVQGMYSGITVSWNNRTKSFPWENISEPAFYPEVATSNIDGKGQDEAIIILTTGKGIGARASAVHVIKDDWTEIPVGDAVTKAKNALASMYKEHTATVEYTMNIAGNEYVYSYPIEDAEMWFKQAVVGNILRYRVQDNKLIAEIPVQVSPGTYTGTIEVEFREYNGELIPSEVSYIEDF